MLNMNKSLDDLIKMNKQAELRQVPNSGEPGPTRRLQNRSANRVVPYSLKQVRVPDTNRFVDHDVAYPAQTIRVPTKETGTKLIISNLNYGVSDKDIMEIFSDVGKVQRYSINYDRNGRSKGTAEVVYSLRRDAEEAMMRYQGVPLDGKCMKVETVGTKMSTPVASIPIKNMYENRYYKPISCHGGRASGIGRHHHRGGGGGRGGRFGRGGGCGYEKSWKLSLAEDLDADLDNYHAKATAAEALETEQGKPRMNNHHH